MLVPSVQEEVPWGIYPVGFYVGFSDDLMGSTMMIDGLMVI